MTIEADARERCPYTTAGEPYCRRPWCGVCARNRQRDGAPSFEAALLRDLRQSPHLADGTPATPGLRVWHRDGGPPARIVEIVDDGLCATVESSNGERANWWLSRAYSSFDDAFAAKPAGSDPLPDYASRIEDSTWGRTPDGFTIEDNEEQQS